MSPQTLAVILAVDISSGYSTNKRFRKYGESSAGQRSIALPQKTTPIAKLIFQKDRDGTSLLVRVQRAILLNRQIIIYADIIRLINALQNQAKMHMHLDHSSSFIIHLYYNLVCLNGLLLWDNVALSQHAVFMLFTMIHLIIYYVKLLSFVTYQWSWQNCMHENWW